MELKIVGIRFRLDHLIRPLARRRYAGRSTARHDFKLGRCSRQYGIVMTRTAFVCISVVVVIGIAITAWGPIVSEVEQPKYDVVERDQNIEVRDYSPMIVAEAEVAGERRAAISAGFRIIAAFIFGENVSAQQTVPTTPAAERTGEKIAMTAPVTQQANGATWHVRFVMPGGYNMDTLPKPRNAAVKLKEITAKRFAVIRFSGLPTENALNSRTNELGVFIKAKGLQTSSSPTYAFYNPPWTLPFLRRNEIMIEIDH